MNDTPPQPPPEENKDRSTRIFGAPMPPQAASPQPFGQPPPSASPYGQQPAPPQGQPPQTQSPAQPPPSYGQPPVQPPQSYGQPPYQNPQAYGQPPYQQQPAPPPFQQGAYGQAPVYAQQPVAPPNYNSLRGVGGWLILLCISLTMLSPLVTLYRLLSAFGPVLSVSGSYPGLLVVTIIDTVLSVGLMAFSIFAGILLWRVAPKAVAITKVYLISLLVYSVLVIPLVFLAGLPSRANEVMLQSGFIGLLRSFVYVAVWFAYLSKSKRVAATYYGDEGGEHTSLNMNR